MNQVPSILAEAGMPVGEYVLDEKIGQGAFGEVWKAHHRAWTDQLAAVKIPTDPAYLRQLQSEGFSLHRLSHPSVVRVIGFDPAATPPYMMTELVAGPSLRKLLEPGKTLAAHAVAICRQILTGLAYAHQQGVVHGDLKPENVLTAPGALANNFASEGAVKLADFGVGYVALTAGLGSGSSSRLQRSGAVSTVSYIAPEQREGGAPDARSDVFAVGVILFELLTGERPAGAESPSELNPAVAPALDEVFRRAYARRERRFASAAEFLAALNIAATRVPPPAPPAALATTMSAESDDDIIGLRPDSEDTSGPALVPMDIAPVEEAPPEAPPPRQAVVPAPAPPPTPAPAKHPARAAQRGVIVIDELARMPLRAPDDLRAIFRKIYLSREMDAGEVANLRLRVDMWAESVGGLPGFGERIEITEALDCPYYRVSVSTQYQQEDGRRETAEEAVVLGNPAAARDCGQAMGPADFGVVIHLSTSAFPMSVLDLIGVGVIRSAMSNLLTAANAAAGGRRIARQEMKLARANVLSLRYLFDGADHGLCFAGAALKVVAPITPVTKMRDDLLKRAASLLDTENIGAGIDELRQMFMTPNPAQPRAERMLIALRAKLSAAYMALAETTAGNMGVFESLDYSYRAAELLPNSEAPAAHERRVRKLAFWVHAGPGLVIGLIFILIAIFNQPSPWGYLAAALASMLAGLWSWRRLGIQTSRTDVAFCHGCLLPLALSAVLATLLKEPKLLSDDVAAAVLVAAVFYVDRMVFRKYSHVLLRSTYREGFTGSPLDVLNQIQRRLELDWERLGSHYVKLPPLYKHASANINEPQLADAPPLESQPEQDSQ